MSAFVRSAARLNFREIAFSLALIGAAATIVAASISTLII